MKLAAPSSKSFRRLVSGIALVHAVGALAAGPSTELTISGAVRTPSTETAATLAARPAITQTDSFASGNSGTQTHTYTGASLWGTLDGAGIVVDPTVRNDVLNKFVVATGSDGYRVVMSLGELSPGFGARPDLIAYAEQSGNATVPLTADGFARITAPGDVKGGRYVSNVVNLDVESAPRVAAGDGKPTTAFTVSGQVAAASSFDLATLQALTPVLRSVGGVVYTGVSLWDLLTAVVGIPTDPNVKNDLLGKYVQATGSDGYSVVFSLGELDPSFGGQPDFIAYLADGVALTTNGFARIVVPNDVQRGRWVSNLVSLQVLGIPEPGTMALVFVGLLGAVRFGRRRSPGPVTVG